MAAPDEKALEELERLLAALPPRPARLNRDVLLFRAGQASMSRSWVWPAAAVASSVTASCLALILVLRPLPQPIVRVIQVPGPAPASSEVTDVESEPATPVQGPLVLRESTSPALSYWRMQQQALRFGAEALPSIPAEGADAPPRAEALGSDLAAGSRPSLIDPSSLSVGEP